MPARCPAFLLCTVALTGILLAAGCLATEIGDVNYNNDTITVSVTNNGEPSVGYLQVTVYELRDLHQEEKTVLMVPVTLQSGSNRVDVLKTLSPGTYKLYVYILIDGDRKTAVIRDIVV